MNSIALLAIGLWIMSFISDQDVPAIEFEKATQVCASHGGLKAVNAAKFFSKRSYLAVCTDDSRITGGK